MKNVKINSASVEFEMLQIKFATCVATGGTVVCFMKIRASGRKIELIVMPVSYRLRCLHPACLQLIASFECVRVHTAARIQWREKFIYFISCYASLVAIIVDNNNNNNLPHALWLILVRSFAQIDLIDRFNRN